MYDTDEAVEALCEAVGTSGRPVWTIFDSDEGEPDGFRLLPDHETLLGYRAPAEAWAIGMVSGGTARVIDGEEGAGRRCQVACVVDRWGTTSGRVRFTDHPSPPDAQVLCEAPEDGRALDVLRRCMGLATSPASESVAGVLTLVWLASLAERARDTGRPVSWSDATALHPVVSLLDCSHLTAGPPAGAPASRRPGDPLATVIDAAVRSWGWDEVRARCVSRHVGIGALSAPLIAWMDAGMLARWLCAEHGEVEEIVAAGLDAVDEVDHPSLRRVVSAVGDGPVFDQQHPLGRSGRRQARASYRPR